jgi:DNA-binding PadR family transcriptional regulator
MHSHHGHFHFGRQHGAGGLGRFGRGFMDGGLGGRPFGMGRKLSSADLQLLILALLEDKPRHGYEIIRSLDQLSNGFYVPSPGMVYPALTHLEKIGHSQGEAQGTRKLYRITKAGLTELEANRSRAEALLAQFKSVGARMERVRRALVGAGGEDSPAVEAAPGCADLTRAQLEFREALAASWSGQPEDRRRLLEVLKRATAEILGKKQAG